MSKTLEQSGAGSAAASRLIIYAGVWFAVFNWGASFVAARFLLHPASTALVALSPVLLAALRFSLASLFFLVPLVRAIVRRLLSMRDLLLLLLLGQLIFSLYFWMQYTGVQQTSASIASILVVGLIPTFTALLEPVFGRTRLALTLLAALLPGFAGVILIIFQQPIAITLRSGFLFGVLCLLGNAFCFALYSHLSKRWLRVISPVVLTGGTMLSGALGLVLLALLNPAQNQWRDVILLNPTQWLALLFLVLVCSVLSYFAYNRALSKLDASRVAVYIYFEPIVTVLLGVTLLREQLTWQSVLGSLAIAASIVLVNWIKRSRPADRTMETNVSDEIMQGVEN
ncbi:MAG TPA: EamA family transporter [Ktedonobacteraceae bacterium]|nr:EamA family transporter [Ktedonobacteraceae bacterium]